MSAPHADRDHREQPTQPEAFVELLPPNVGHNLRHLGPERAHVTGEECHCSPERIPHPTHAGTSRSVSAREVRASEAQIEAARDAMRQFYDGSPDAPRGIADAVVAAGPDADEVTRLRAELKRLGLEVAKVARERSAAEAEAARLRRAWDTHDTDCAAVEAERDRLAEVVARIEMLAETMANEHGQSWNSITARRIQVALSGPKPAETPQNGPEPALSREQGASGQSGEGEALGGAEKGSGCGAGCF